MKNSTYLIILLALGLLFTTYKWVSAPETAAVNVENTTINDIMTRTSVRSYSGKAVKKVTVDTLLRAAMAAPTAGNKQPWRFVVVNNRQTLRTIGEEYGSMKMAAEAPVAVIMCGEPAATFPGEGVGYWIQDVSAATENLLLAAHAMGLGAVWCGIYPIQERVDKFRSILSLPEDIIPMACVCVGYPEGESTPKDKWNPEYIHYNKWHSPTELRGE